MITRDFRQYEAPKDALDGNGGGWRECNETQKLSQGKASQHPALTKSRWFRIGELPEEVLLSLRFTLVACTRVC